MISKLNCYTFQIFFQWDKKTGSQPYYLSSENDPLARFMYMKQLMKGPGTSL